MLNSINKKKWLARPAREAEKSGILEVQLPEATEVGDQMVGPHQREV
jgi:hypothetical protein